MAQDHRVATPRGEVFARSWTPEGASPESPALLLFHDSLGSVALWRDFPEALARATGLRTLAWDRPGFGASEARRDLPQPDFVARETREILPALFSGLEIGGFVAFGHSVGGGMAVEAGAAFPEACAAVTTESAQAFVEPRTLEGVRAARAQFARPGEMGRLERHHGDKARWVLEAWTETWLAPDFADWSLDAALGRLTAPLLALHGDQDEYGSLAHPERLTRLTRGPQEMRILAGCGHVPHRERPEEVLKAVAEFLRRHEIARA
ncbi:alpha/beta fold hydrolase [Neomegalonema sp.]|uniref:alpha/beta fold hydrolase n=1 Tax=Neomegalonema sp. TaxID=2039713 RepID=UPI00261FB298|nr:alpha/beta fold hydrolase [Neomegalonema sp.]MDD2868654.1 alpha/beta fold hydrolase [Neomegalonema sp.]